ncbi:cytidine deaminase-like protein [Thamnocephalis sphaerospora]|uniref:Cytidine deaminase n=1 Tax=Thamnocephalis sphaerospora TaxID=78915 RepID=A0A4P9XGA0_9FUNG|nr:cytidine deaminase-like protein [Thamnocephalis sphaerospora]|eukprot:RKP04598.1 cytidine deaminase-like protein [Thamnocephalis sphaerospora]
MASQEKLQELVQLSLQMRDRAYCPYSKFRVGAALLAKSGKIYTGCNVENASYGGCICGERTAFVKAVSEGDREFTDLAVSTDRDDFCSPCGICRQFMAEFGLDLRVHQVSTTGQFKTYTMNDLLPGAFGPSDLID